MQKESTTINHKKTVEQMFLIFDMSHNSRLILEVDTEGDLVRVDEMIRLNDAINFISGLFDITLIQSCLLSIVFVSQMNNHQIDFEKLLYYLDLELPNFFDIQQEMQGLIDKRILKFKREIDTRNLYQSSFKVNPKVIDALFNNNSIEEGLLEPEVDFVQLCGHISRIIRSHSDRRLSIFNLVERVRDIENWNQNLIAVQSLKELKVNIEDRILLYSLTESLTTYSESRVNLSILIKQVFGSSNYPFILSTFLNGEHDLQRKELIHVDKEANLVEELTIELTAKAIVILLGDSASFYTPSPSTTHHHCICCESHAAKQSSLSNIRKSIKKLLSRFGKKSQTKNAAN